MSSNKKALNIVTDILNEYLTKNGYRKTPERYAILEQIYSSKIHQNAEQIHLKLLEEKFRISKATVYNTLELLLECKLIRKHQFDKHEARYEKSHASIKHDHVILEDGKIIEFCDPRIQIIKKTVEDLFNVQITGHSLYFYGKNKDSQ